MAVMSSWHFQAGDFDIAIYLSSWFRDCRTETSYLKVGISCVAISEPWVR